MNRFLVRAILLLNLVISIHAYAQSVDSLHSKATAFIMKGDADNALMFLRRAEQQEPANLETTKLIAFTYYNQRDFASALPYARRLAVAPKADFQQVQMAGLVFKALAMYKEAKKLYDDAMSRFAGNGTLLSEYGELLYLMKDDDAAIVLWEKGIAAEPNIASNYYHAANYYSVRGNFIWSILYAEIFANLESFSARTTDMKALVLKDYKRLFSRPLIDPKTKYSPFTLAVLQTLNSFSSLVADGVTPSTLNQLRKSFYHKWEMQHANTYPFRLFDRYKEYIIDNSFEAYNYWLLTEDAQVLRQWALNNKDAFNAFLSLQNGRVFKVPKGQYYAH